MGSTNSLEMLELLDATLETYGADASRWPEASRGKLQLLINNNADALLRFKEAQALDRVLGFAPVVTPEQHGSLVDRIVLAAERQPRVVVASDVRRQRADTLWKRNPWAVGALAASLLIGLFAGQQPEVTSLADAALGGDATTSQQIAQGLDVDTLWDEDVL